ALTLPLSLHDALPIYLVVRFESNLRSSSGSFPDDLYFRLGFSPFVPLEVDLPVPPDFRFQPGRKGIYNRNPDAVETAGNLIMATAKLTAGVELSHNHFQGGNFLLRVDVHRNPRTVISNGNGAVPA